MVSAKYGIMDFSGKNYFYWKIAFVGGLNRYNKHLRYFLKKKMLNNLEKYYCLYYGKLACFTIVDNVYHSTKMV